MKVICDLRRLFFHISTTMLVDLDHTLQDATKAGHHLASIVAILRWEVGAAIEGPSIWSQKDGHWPAALLCQCLNRLHINAVNVWTFFAIHFYRNKMLVHEGGDLLVLEGLALHDMAPVAGRVAD